MTSAIYTYMARYMMDDNIDKWELFLFS